MTACYIALLASNSSSQNRDLKLLVSLVPFYDPYSSIIFKNYVVLMSSYGLYVMSLGFCVSGNTAAVHTGDMGSNPIFSFNDFVFQGGFVSCIILGCFVHLLDGPRDCYLRLL